MNDVALKSDTPDIVVEEVLPYAPETIWKALTTSEMIGRWLMAPTGFEPVKGKHFTFQTTPAGAWDVRALIGTRSPVAFEVAYVGTALKIHDPIGSDPTLTTTSVEGVCSSCQDLRVAPSPRSRDRALTQRRVTRSQPRNA